MKNVSTKIAYMVIGSLLTIIGYHFGNIDNNTADAQEKADTPIADEIRGRRFVIVNEDGERVVVIGAAKDGAGAMAILKDRKPLVVIGAAKDGSSAIITNNKDGTPIVGIRANKDGSGAIETHNKDGTPIVVIGTNEYGSGAIETHNKDGIPIVAISITKDGSGLIETFTPRRKIPRRKIPSLDKEGGMLYKKGDKLPRFDYGDIVKRSGHIERVNRNNKTNGALIVGELSPNENTIKFIGENTWIELSNGTRYTCETEKCIIDMETHTISEGEISVSYKGIE